MHSFFKTNQKYLPLWFFSSSLYFSMVAHKWTIEIATFVLGVLFIFWNTKCHLMLGLSVSYTFYFLYNSLQLGFEPSFSCADSEWWLWSKNITASHLHGYMWDYKLVRKYFSSAEFKPKGKIVLLCRSACKGILRAFQSMHCSDLWV